MHREPFGEVRNARLCRRICGDLGKRTEGIHRGDVDDIAARFDHIGSENLRYEESRCNIQIEYEFESAFVKREESPVSRTIKETSFVFQDKRGFSFAQKTTCAIRLLLICLT
jgi:hypothetical protein